MDGRRAGLIDGTIGVVIFSGSIVGTRLAVIDLDPMFMALARTVAAALVAGLALLLTRQRLPRRAEIPSLAIVAAAVVIGFPVLAAFALREISAARATLYMGLIPLFTAAFGVLRTGAVMPRPAFWLFAVTGSAAVALYAWDGRATGSLLGDGLIFASIVCSGIGYAEGARLTPRLGGWQVISWALVLALPITLPGMLLGWPDWSTVGWPAIGGLAYVAVFSQWLGFLFWYRGLERGGIAAVSQLQLLQPFLGMILAALLLGEAIGPRLWLATAAVVACVFAARRFAAPPRRHGTTAAPGSGTAVASVAARRRSGGSDHFGSST
jgi:drug/metabolite transporter (DMT)-like permease